MTYFEKLEKVIQDFNRIQLDDNNSFFIDTVMQKLIVVHELLIFPYIENENFQRYIGLFRNDLRLDIARSINISDTDSQAGKLLC